MSDEAKVRELFASFAGRPVDLTGREFPVNRAAAVDVILKAADDGHRARPRRMAIWGTAVAAGLALAASAALFIGGGEESVLPASAASATVSDVAGVVTHIQAGASRVVPAGDDPSVIEPNGELRTGKSSSARLRNARGARVVLLENSRLVLSGFELPASSVKLLGGSIHCEVSELSPGQRFSVVTPQGTVEVRGTAFTVSVSGIASAARTCVKVEKGSVAIIGGGPEKHIVAGQSWGCEPEPQATPFVAEREAAAARDAVTGRSSAGNKSNPRVHDRGDGNAVNAGTLDEENRLFQAGLAAEHRRDLAAAGAAFEQLLTRFPASPLTNDARRARTRIKQAQAPGP